jgi:hypothetical protein
MATVDGKDGAVRLWDLARGKELPAVGAHAGALGVAFSPDNATLATIGDAPFVRFWDVAARKESGRLEAARKSTAVLFSPDGQTLAVSGDAYSIWDVKSGKERFTFGSRSDFGGMAFSPDGRVLATSDGYGRNGIRLWDAATGKLLHTFQGNDQGVYGVAFSPDGRLLAVGGAERDDAVHVIELASWGEARIFRGHHSGIIPVSFSPNGRLIASGGGDSTVLLWDVTGRLENGRLRPDKLSPERLETLWKALAAADAKPGQDAIWTLTASPTESLPYLQTHIKPAKPLDETRFNELIKNLDAPDFADRESAARSLEHLGDAAAPALRKALDSTTSQEARKAIPAILDKLDGPEWLRQRRTVQALEYMATPDSRRLLEILASGAETARLTAEAETALRRLNALR